jgi:hypothetical protein
MHPEIDHGRIDSEAPGGPIRAFCGDHALELALRHEEAECEPVCLHSAPDEVLVAILAFVENLQPTFRLMLWLRECMDRMEEVVPEGGGVAEGVAAERGEGRSLDDERRPRLDGEEHPRGLADDDRASQTANGDDDLAAIFADDTVTLGSERQCLLPVQSSRTRA